MFRYFALLFCLLVPSEILAQGQCESSKAVREILDRFFRDQPDLPRAERRRLQMSLLDQGLKKHPHDYFLLRNRWNTEESYNVGRRWAEDLYKQNPGHPVYIMLYARSLAGKDTPRAIQVLEELQAAHPKEPRAYLDLIEITDFGKFRDKERAKKNLAKFLELCPTPLSPSAMSIIQRHGTPEQLAATARGVRSRLMRQSDHFLRRDSWTSLWSLEFKVRPMAEHDAVRVQIAADLARLEESLQARDPEWLSFLRTGYSYMTDPKASEKITDEILQRHPASDVAKRIVQDRWYKENPFPREASEEKRNAYQRASLAIGDEWHKRWPNDSMILAQRFRALKALPDSTPERIEKASTELLAAYRKNPNWYSMPPIEFSVAEAWVKYKINLDQVPAVIDEGYQAARKRQADMTEDDRYDGEMRGDGSFFLENERSRVLLDYYAATNQAEKANEIDAQLFKLNVPGESKSILLARRAQAAEVAGRKLDALLFYRSAIQARTRPVTGKDDLAEKVDKLWKELGGTPETRAMLAQKPQVIEATDSRWERPKNPLPAFSLLDMEGKTWKLTELSGKAVLANVWATWCGPCRAEHPEFQKLYDQLKGRKDVVLLSLNVDDDLGKIAPYMTENKYTFPVLLGRDTVDAVVPLLSIPRNWFIGRAGKLEWEQIGFGGDPSWRDTMIAKLEEVLKLGTPD